MAPAQLSFPFVDGISPLVHPQPLAPAYPSRPHQDHEPHPVVLLTIGGALTSVDEAVALIDRFASVDDVYSASFGRSVVLQSVLGARPEPLVAQFKAEASEQLSAIYSTPPVLPQHALPAGPYFLSRGSIHQARG